MDGYKSRMLIGCFFFIRVLILRVLGDIEMMFPEDFNNFSRKNAHLVGSMIYHSFKKFFIIQFPTWEETNSSALAVQIGKRNFPSE